MKKAQLSLLLSHILFLFLTINNTVLVDGHGRCLNDQRSYLLQFKNSVQFDLQYSTKLVQWNKEEDCCSWGGVGCDAHGRVTTLELHGESITGGADNLTSLFRLQFLEKLNLGGNNFNDIHIPKAIANLTSLVSLDLSFSGFVGQIPVELSSIHNLSVIILDGSTIYDEVPEFFANMQNLRILSLSSCNLLGKFPTKIFQLPALQTLDLSNNKLLHGSLPPFPKNSSLRKILLLSTSFSGSLPKSLGNLHMLSSIDLGFCNFSGTLSSAHFKGLQSLELLYLNNNFFSGRLPSSLFKLPTLISIALSSNQFFGQIDEIPTGGLSMSRMEYVDLSSNQLNGSFPKFLFEIIGLEYLSVSSNSFQDNIHLETFKNLPNLTYLDLSHSNLIVELQSYSLSLEKIEELKLASCKLKTFPELKNSMRMKLEYLDLSDNEFTGKIPSWIWNLGLRYLNLSFNSFVGLEQPYNISTLEVLDLRSNQLKGELPNLSSHLDYVDFSKNNFSGPIPPKLNSQSFMSLSDNSLTGSIPNSICGPRFLDLSNNSLIGTIPSCLVDNELREVLNLAGNNLNGSIPDTFPANCRLKTLELGRNKLQGKLPITLSGCTMLEALNLENNKIEDVFPCMFETSSNLQILILRSNNFHGELECFGYDYSWSQLQIIDIASNNFSGVLSSHFFSSLENMLTLDFLTLDFTQESSRVGHMRFMSSGQSRNAYQFKVKVYMNGFEIELDKILTIIFTSIDFSNNKFSGNIPESIGDLKGLYLLNLSHNEITGGIPSSVGKLSNLASLDLSRNQLTGDIPSALQDLMFLSYLNLSFNMLTGKIPTGGSQLQTYTRDSYNGNVGLCGFPLNVRCGDATYNGSSSMPSLSNKKAINWMFVCASMGYIAGLGILYMLLLLCAKCRNKLFLQVDHFLVEVFGPVWRDPIRRL